MVKFVGGLGGVRKSREKTKLVTVVDGCKGGGKKKMFTVVDVAWG